MPTRRYYVNNAPQQTLTAQINNSVTSLSVTSFTGWPTQFPFFATLELGTANEEIVSVTNIVGGTATIVRGQDGSTAISHLAGATFDFTVVRQDLDEANAHTSANSGVHGVSGNVVGTSDVQTLTNKTIASPTITGTATVAALSVTGNATVGGTSAITGASTAASYTANGNGQVTGVLAPKQYTNEAAAGTATAGLVVYLTTPTTAGYNPGLYRGNGTIWVPVDLSTDSNAVQTLFFAPAGSTTTPLSGTATWISPGNVTVPVWATKVAVSWGLYGLISSASEPNITIALKVGTAAGNTFHLLGHGSATGRFGFPINETVSPLAATGSQAVTVFATWISGTNTFNADVNARFTAKLIFMP